MKEMCCRFAQNIEIGFLQHNIPQLIGSHKPGGYPGIAQLPNAPKSIYELSPGRRFQEELPVTDRKPSLTLATALE